MAATRRTKAEGDNNTHCVCSRIFFAAPDCLAYRIDLDPSTRSFSFRAATGRPPPSLPPSLRAVALATEPDLGQAWDVCRRPLPQPRPQNGVRASDSQSGSAGERSVA